MYKETKTTLFVLFLLIFFSLFKIIFGVFFFFSFINSFISPPLLLQQTYHQHSLTNWNNSSKIQQKVTCIAYPYPMDFLRGCKNARNISSLSIYHHNSCEHQTDKRHFKSEHTWCRTLSFNLSLQMWFQYTKLHTCSPESYQ